jgi:hypothetical protein
MLVFNVGNIPDPQADTGLGRDLNISERSARLGTQQLANVLVLMGVVRLSEIQSIGGHIVAPPHSR